MSKEGFEAYMEHAGVGRSTQMPDAGKDAEEKWHHTRGERTIWKRRPSGRSIVLMAIGETSETDASEAADYLNALQQQLADAQERVRYLTEQRDYWEKTGDETAHKLADVRQERDDLYKSYRTVDRNSEFWFNAGRSYEMEQRGEAGKSWDELKAEFGLTPGAKGETDGE